MRNINDEGLNLIKEFEGCKLEAYKDIADVLTIGYGHTGPDVYEGMAITPDAAENLLRSDLHLFETGVTNRVKTNINDNQFSALVSFSYNLGLGTLGKSMLLEFVNDNNFSDAANEFELYSKSKGRTVPGLLRRRRAEKELFLKS